MPGPALPALVAGGLAAARGARSLYRAGRAGVSAMKKFDRDNKFISRPMAAAATYGALDTNDRFSKKNKKQNTRNSNPTDFSRKLIK
jgi:hypothetical protein